VATADDADLVKEFERLFREYYDDEIRNLALGYPDEAKSLYLDWSDLYRFDPDLAEDYRSQPEQLQEYAEEALRLYDLPIDMKLGQAHVRIRGLLETTEIREIRSRHINTLVHIPGMVRETTDVQPKIQQAAFECQRCGTLTHIPQSGDDFQEPHECQGCERQGPFQINHDLSEFIDNQVLTLAESPHGLSGGEVPQMIHVHVSDDLAGQADAGSSVTVTGIVRLKSDGQTQETEGLFDIFIEGISVEDSDRSRSVVSTSPQYEFDIESYVDAASNVLTGIGDRPREEETKAKLITPLLEALGWNKFENSEFRLEYTYPQSELRPDYALFGPESDSPDIIVEAKSLGTELDQEESQLYDYLYVFSPEWGLLTDGQEFYLYQYVESDHPNKVAELETEDLPTADVLDNLKRIQFVSDPDSSGD